MNTIKTMVLMVGLTVLLVLVGGGLWGRNGMMLFFGIAMVMNLVNYWFSDKIVLKMYGAKEVTDEEAPVLYSVTRELASRGQTADAEGLYYSFRRLECFRNRTQSRNTRLSPQPKGSSRLSAAKNSPGLWRMNCRTCRTATF